VTTAGRVRGVDRRRRCDLQAARAGGQRRLTAFTAEFGGVVGTIGTSRAGGLMYVVKAHV
jgi:hypothetical protein